MVDFSSIVDIVIPEGNVVQITAEGKVIWSKETDDSGVILTAVDASAPVVVKTSTAAGDEYRINNGKWTHYDTATEISGNKIAIRCVDRTRAHLVASNADATGVTSTSGKFKLSGYVADLLDYKKRQEGTITYGDSCFYTLAQNCTTLTDISELIIPDIVTQYMWQNAFYGCIALTKVWDTLPAKKAAYSCYDNMFCKCTALTKAPEIMLEEPAMYCLNSCFEGCTALTTIQQKTYFTKVLSYCFQNMFKDCTSLKTGLDISGITGTDGSNVQSCFLSMYQGCSSLTSATLPKKFDYANIGTYVFQYMFKNCTSLVTAPAFPDFSTFSGTSFTTAHRFESMYEGCTSLKELPAAITWYPTVTYHGSECEWKCTFKGCTSITTVPDNYFAIAPKITDFGYEWAEFTETFSGCTSLTSIGRIFGDNYNTTSSIGASYMFYNCTKLASMPTDTWFCTRHDVTSMFEGCTSLTSAQGITLHSSTDGTESIVATQMFKGCTALTSVDISITATSPVCTHMFDGCTALKTVNENLLSGMTTAKTSACAYMFYNCTALTTTIKLPATALSSDCYNRMFCFCSSLTKAPELPATTLEAGCYSNMFQNCASLASAPALPATTIATYCYQYMFFECTSLTEIPVLPATALANRCYYSMFQGCTGLKLSETKTGEYNAEYRIPAGTATGTDATNTVTNMFAGTGGTFTGTPSINTTYYMAV